MLKSIMKSRVMMRNKGRKMHVSETCRRDGWNAEEKQYLMHIYRTRRQKVPRWVHAPPVPIFEAGGNDNHTRKYKATSTTSARTSPA
eukprot:959735-Alexandrium_andersonii.AAC.1